MKTRMLLTAVAVSAALAVSTGVAMANSCPTLIKQGREAAAKAPAGDAKTKQAVAKLDEAQKLHESGKHAESMAAAKEANAMLGVK